MRALMTDLVILEVKKGDRKMLKPRMMARPDLDPDNRLGTAK